MKKVLFVSHTANFAKFNYPFMRWFHEQGWQVDYVSDGKEDVRECDYSYTIDFERFPFHKNNIKAYSKLKKLMKEQQYDLIHCHTPVGGILARLAARSLRKKGTNVIYTGHGFHFYKGAPILNWLIYYPIEKIAACYTDLIVTINEEDYQTAVRKHFPAKQIAKIDGVGVDLTRFTKVSNEEKVKLREKYQYHKEDFLLICVAEINKNKNQAFMIENLSYLKNKIPSLKLLLVGVGPEKEQCEKLVQENQVDDSVEFLGYRSDVDKLLQISDVLVSASGREGLAVNIIEAMATGLPVVCANTRGQRDLIENENNGFVFELNDSKGFCDAILKLWKNKLLREQMSAYSLEHVKTYSLEKAIKNMERLYQQYM